ncbi:hypothetical protein [Paludibaculum fermentans]|uniref:hypothetical protein n=1 Tax=Paludibaculum fermentans TaxID=1473598 RepID=UPI003EB6FA4D
MISQSLYLKLAAITFFLPLCLPAQDAGRGSTLSVDGVPGEAATVTVKGKVYVDVDTLVQLLGASQQRAGSRVTVYLRNRGADDPDNQAKLSRPFIVAGIELMSTIREWRHMIITSTAGSVPFLEERAGPYGRNADSKLSLASTAAATDADRSVLDLLNKETDLMRKFNDKYVALRKSSLGVLPEAVENDPLGLQILECARGLAALAGSQRFQDVLACH